MISKTDEIGLVNGLAWTSVGGEILPIEVAVMQGTGKIEITGDKRDEQIIKGVIKNTNLKDILNEAKSNYKAAKKNGDIDRASKNLKCPVCGEPVDSNKTYCTNCGTKLR